MAKKAGRACVRRGCAGIVYDGVCSVCGPVRRVQQRNHDALRGSSTQRGYGYRWQSVRLAYLREHPLCVECARRGSIVAATDVDHVVAKRKGGNDEESNLQALCHECHSRKTARGG